MSKQPRITLYVNGPDPKEGGKKLDLTEPEPDLRQSAFNDRCSSLVVHKGVWALYEHSNYGGDMWIVWEGQDYRNWTKWGGKNDALSSLKPLSVESSDDSKCKVFADGFNKGQTLELRGPIEKLSEFNFNDKCSFVEVLSGTWVGYIHPGFNGPQILLPKGRHGFPKYNDQLSSIRPIEIDFPTTIVKFEYSMNSFTKTETPKSLCTLKQENHTCSQQEVTFAEENVKTTTESYQFKWGFSTSVEIKAECSIGIPDIGAASMSVTTLMEASEESINGTEQTTEKTWTLTIPSKVREHTRLTMKCRITEGQASVPFTAWMKKGNKVWKEKGMWYGVQCYNIRTKFVEEKLEECSNCDKTDQQ